MKLKPMNRPVICFNFFDNDSIASKLCHLEAQAYCFIVVLSTYRQLTRGDSEERNNSCARVECSSQSQLRCSSVKMRSAVSMTIVAAFLQHGMGYTQERRYVEVSLYKLFNILYIIRKLSNNTHAQIIFSRTVVIWNTILRNNTVQVKVKFFLYMRWRHRRIRGIAPLILTLTLDGVSG